ncbi:uncharacterized protein LOC115613045 [Strigops habroptila]|uniref:uncharacterized protein LOC115613045 n=1 Tax=Strigops habroptila TaxID=2489341 RepID=UPI0011CF2EA3|nr:uncharacterized protein LOC115613045 [Strigops habroptila]
MHLQPAPGGSSQPGVVGSRERRSCGRTWGRALPQLPWEARNARGPLPAPAVGGRPACAGCGALRGAARRALSRPRHPGHGPRPTARLRVYNAGRRVRGRCALRQRRRSLPACQVTGASCPLPRVPARGAVTGNRLFQVRGRRDDEYELLPHTQNKKRTLTRAAIQNHGKLLMLPSLRRSDPEFMVYFCY